MAQHLPARRPPPRLGAGAIPQEPRRPPALRRARRDVRTVRRPLRRRPLPRRIAPRGRRRGQGRRRRPRVVGGTPRPPLIPGTHPDPPVDAATSPTALHFGGGESFR